MRILLIINETASDRLVLELGAYLSRSCEQSLTLLTVCRRKEERIRSEATLDEASNQFRSLSVELEKRIRIGRYLEEILRETEEGQHEMIIIGDRTEGRRHKPNQTRHDLNRIVERAPIPVLLAKGKFRPIRKILLCDSGGGAADLSDFTAKFACMMDGEEEITVLHVMSQISAGPGVEGKQLQADAEALIRERSPEGWVFTHDIEILDQPMIRSHPKVRHGFVVDEILQEAREGDYDLVIIGAHLQKGWRGMLLDDIAHKILKWIDRSILVVH